MRPRIPLLVIGLLATFAIALIAFGALCQNSSADAEIRIGLGCRIDDPAAVERLALRHISAALAQHPAAKVIGVRWSDSPLYYVHLDDEYDRWGVVYDRDMRSLWFYNNGGEAGWEGVTPGMIARSENSNSPYMSFKPYGCRARP